jgi:hypothetical protein
MKKYTIALLGSLSTLIFAMMGACGDDETTTGTTTTTTRTSASSTVASGTGGMGGMGAMGGNGGVGNCDYCAELLDKGPFNLCPHAAMLFEDLVDCQCSTCLDDCQASACSNMPPDQGCVDCFMVGCSTEWDACMADTPPGTGGGGGAGGTSNTGGSGGM